MHPAVAKTRSAAELPFETWQLCDTDRALRISGGMLKVANAKYNTTNNELELTMSVDSKGSVHQSLEQIQRRPVAYAFKKIANLPSLGLNSCVDVIGAVAKIEPPKLVTTGEGKEISRSKVSLVDDSGFSVSCTFWGSATGQVASMSEGDVLAIKGAKIHEYAGSICLGCSASKLTLNPDDADARGIREWYALARAGSTQFRPLVSGRGLRGDCATNGDGAFVMEFPAHMQTSFDRLRKIRIRCGNKQLLLSYITVCVLTVVTGAAYYWQENMVFTIHDPTGSIMVSNERQRLNCWMCIPAFNLSTVSSSAASRTKPQVRATPAGVPMILHFVYKDTNILEAYRSSLDSCIKMNSNWTVMLWTDATVRTFVSREYPQYVSGFYGFPHKIQRADAVRYLIMYRFGGVYLDLDMRCRQPLLQSLSRIPCFLDREREHQSRVLHGRQYTAMNSAMGCRAGHPFFKKLMDFVFHPDRLKGAFSFPYTIFVTTGPFAVTQLYDEWRASNSQPIVQLLSESYFSPKINPRSGVYGTCRNVVQTLDKKSSNLSTVQNACLELQALEFEKSDTTFITTLTVAIHEFTHLGYNDHSSPKFNVLQFYPSVHLYPNISLS